MGSADDVLRVDSTPSSVSVTFGDGSEARFNRFWLRDNGPDNGERGSLFRSFSVDDLADDLCIAGARSSRTSIEVRFSDGVTERFPGAWLWAEHRRQINPGPDGVVPWRAGHCVDTLDLGGTVVGSRAHLRLLEAVARSGFALVTGLPAVRSATESLAALLGHVRETDFGRVFDIVVEPHPFTPSQSDEALDPHTDDPYRYTPAGISVLHCVEPNRGGGGETLIVDGFAIAQEISEQHPDEFELLTSVAVPFVHRRPESVEQGDDVHLRADAPVVSVDDRGQVKGVRFHERSLGPLPIEAELAERYYPALRRFARAVRGGAFTWRRALLAGEAVVYDNQRVLHGRTAVTGRRSRRHLRLCTVDRDQVHSRLRRLREQFGTGTETDPLPSGSLS